MFLFVDPKDKTNFPSSTWLEILNRDENKNRVILTPHSTSEMKTGETPKQERVFILYII